MREILQQVIATEAEAKGLIQAARAEADRVVAGAQAQARDLLEQARREARQETERILTTADAGAKREKAERLGLAMAEIDTQTRLEETQAQKVVEAALRSIRGFG